MSKSQEFTLSYNRWVSADQACEEYGRFIKSLTDKREAALTRARLTPAKSTPAVALLDGQLAATAEIARLLWRKRQIVYSAHRALVKKRALAGRRKREAAAAVAVSP